MHIEYLRLKNFRAFREVELRDIPKFCVVVGANGSGKSTLFSVFGFLRDAMTSNVTSALAKLGGSRGFREVRSRNSDGPIEIELKFRQSADRPQLVTYELSIDERNGRPVVAREMLRYRRGSKGQPWRFLDFTEGRGSAVTNEFDGLTDDKDQQREDQSLKSPDLLAI